MSLPSRILMALPLTPDPVTFPFRRKSITFSTSNAIRIWFLMDFNSSPMTQDFASGTVDIRSYTATVRDPVTSIDYVFIRNHNLMPLQSQNLMTSRFQLAMSSKRRPSCRDMSTVKSQLHYLPNLMALPFRNLMTLRSRHPTKSVRLCLQVGFYF